MDIITEKVLRFHDFVFYELADHRNDGFFFMDKPMVALLVLLFYIYFVLKLGPDFMKNRPAYNLKKVILVFDGLQVLINGYLVYKGISAGWLWKFSFLCTEVDMEDNEHTRNVAYLCYVYFLVKITDFLDTVFFVLTKKFNHISFLHIYHHAGMAMLAYGNAKFYPGGHHTFVGVMNCFVHTIMYCYYLVTTIYPQKKLFKVKKFVTQIQMYQFLIAFIHMSMVMFSSCVYPKWVNFIVLPNNLMIFILFYDFYRKTYYPKKKTA